MMSNIFALILIALALYFILTEFLHCKECFQNYLGASTKCFDCEKQYPDDQKWKGQPSKCFDCEKELQVNNGDAAAYQGKQMRCFDCRHEQQPLENMNSNLVL
jgi:hypothetical protein